MGVESSKASKTVNHVVVATIALLTMEIVWHQ